MILTKNRNVLPRDYQLQEYRIQSILGHGGFGITYLALDTKLNHQVAIKEYFPSDLAVREEGYSVHPKFQKYKKNFGWGLKRFLNEGQALATFQHPNIVRVLRYFEGQNTAYIVMEYEQGESFSELLKNNKILSESEIMTFLPQLLSGLQAVHEKGFLHRDIKPANIYLRERDKTPVLLDFGAARYAIGNLSRSITALVTPGYTPFEQYQTKGPSGPWTDIYAVGAVLYRAISGEKPVESPARINVVKLNDETDPLQPITQVARRKKYSKRLLQGIDWALQLSEKDRPQNVKEWAEAMLPKSYHGSLQSSPEPFKKCGKWRWIFLVAVATMFNIGYFIYGHTELRRQQVIEIQLLEKKAESKKAELAQLKSEEIAMQTTIKEANAQFQKSLKAKEVEQDRFNKLKQQIIAKEAYLAQVKETLKEAGSKIPGNIIRDQLQDGSLGPEMVVIPAGQFRMGDVQEGGYKDEQPVHWTSVNHFAMGRYEVTFEEYDHFTEATGRDKPDDQGWGRGKRPVINVSWEDANAYAVWLSEQTGKKYRLPTETEWEYAARAETERQYWWDNEIGTQRANCQGCKSQWDMKETAPVGSFSANTFGLYDTVGNVWEWTCSKYESQYTGQEQECINDDNNQSDRVIRGGSWFNKPRDVRAANRNWIRPSIRYYGYGFRLVLVFQKKSSVLLKNDIR
ncbi:MAG: SUMF1/EgtB/PvdO family nonheme iron enzyme [Thiomargarita sp.]|nr:SUMF1/EgtB/PvdO family nonheme iron enzyme [Thiomargarita sp.]